MSRATKNLTGNQYLVTHSVGNGGMRLDNFLKVRYRARSREKLKRAIDSGAIFVVRGGGPHHTLGKVKPSFVLRQGDVVHVLSTRRPEPPVNFDYKVLFEDEDILVVNKPANLPVHPAGRYFFHTLLIHLKTNGFTSELDSSQKFFLVHRIDKETSGVLLIAKNSRACAILTDQFVKRQTDKYYLALVNGQPDQKKFIVDQALAKMSGSAIGLKMHPVSPENGGYPSLTHFSLIDSKTGTPQGSSEKKTFSLIACFPKTGRQHQIRAHADQAGYPLVGDKIYGLSDEFALALIGQHRLKIGGLPHFSSPIKAAENEDVLDEELLGDKIIDEEIIVDTLASDELVSDEMIADRNSKEPFKITDTTTASLTTPTILYNGALPDYDAELHAKMEAKLLLPRHALHAAGLKFVHPTTGKEMKFESGLPDDLKEFYVGLDQKELLPDLFKNLF